MQRECVGRTPPSMRSRTSRVRAVEELLIGIEHDWGVLLGNFLPSKGLGRNKTESTKKVRRRIELSALAERRRLAVSLWLNLGFPPNCSAPAHNMWEVKRKLSAARQVYNMEVLTAYATVGSRS